LKRRTCAIRELEKVTVMRKILLSILLASAAASPVLAQDRGEGRGHHDEQQSDRSQAREERRQQREEARSERSGGGANSERLQQPRPERVTPQFERRQEQQQQVQVQVQDNQRGNFDRSRLERGNNGPPIVEAPQQDVERGTRGNWNRDRGGTGDRSNSAGDGLQRSDGPSGWTRTQNGWTRDTGDLRHSDRPVPNVMRTRNPLVVSGTPREGTQPPLRTERRHWSTGNWNTNWRRDGRYDWHNWRNRHRSLFHIGIYYDPFGWSYRPYQIGWRLWPSYYGRQYWIDDPYEYRLPYAPPGTVWIRYWDDALLVDTWTGEVVDVIHNFFW
jgi:Ni/Co efflux regulator RcnB